MGLLPQGFTLAIDVLGVAVGCPGFISALRGGSLLRVFSSLWGWRLGARIGRAGRATGGPAAVAFV